MLKKKSQSKILALGCNVIKVVFKLADGLMLFGF